MVHVTLIDKYIAQSVRVIRSLWRTASTGCGTSPSFIIQASQKTQHLHHQFLFGSHVQHRIQSYNNTVMYCMRYLTAVLLKAERSEVIAVNCEVKAWESPVEWFASWTPLICNRSSPRWSGTTLALPSPTVGIWRKSSFHDSLGLPTEHFWEEEIRNYVIVILRCAILAIMFRLLI